MAKITSIRFQYGPFASLPVTGMNEGEPLWCNDTGQLFIASGATTKMTAVPHIGSLSDSFTVATGDLILMEDIDGAGVKAKKITFADFKTALNIPAASTDEKVAVVAAGTAGYIWGTDGTDGVLRVSEGIQWSKDAGNGFVTFNFGFTSEAQGDLAVRGATVWDRFAKGAAYQFLKVDAAGTTLEWSSDVIGGTF